VNSSLLRKHLIRVASALTTFLLLCACESNSKNVAAAPPPRTYPLDNPKPLPPDAGQPPPAPAFADVPLVDSRLPEETWFADAYNRVGKPRIAVLVNRTLDGDLIPVEPAPADQSAPPQSPPPNTQYLQPGQYEDAQLQTLDYEEMESLLTQWIGSRGQVTVLAPEFVRSHLSDQQLKDLQSGKASSLSDLGQSTQADILIQVQAHPTRRLGQLVILLVGQAVNIHGGESISQASVEMPMPLDRPEEENFTRFIARKLIHGMVDTWSSAPPEQSSTPQAPPQTPAPLTPAPSTKP
jgi:hypothetical protein